MSALALATTFAASASASPTPPKQEIYPATESETDPAPSAASAVAKKKPAQTSRMAPRPAHRTLLPAKASHAAPDKLPDSALAYDLVPSDQIDPLAKRLQLVDMLIRKHARAYDYRNHTVAELETILTKLDATESSAPKKAQNAAPSTELPIPSEKDEMSGDEGRARSE